VTAVALASGGYLYVSGKPQSKHQIQAGFEEGSFRWQGHSVKPFSLHDVKQWLDKAAKSYSLPEKSQGVTRWDSIRLASNSPSEDNLVASRSPAGDGGQPWLFWGVFDGHK
jgi:pyruvate dehydrogenase phosphatase